MYVSMYRLCRHKFVSVLYVRCEIESSCFLIETRWSHPACCTIGTSITLIVSGTTTHYTWAGSQALTGRQAGWQADWQAGRLATRRCTV
jgi:hypothetical protein